MRIPLRVPPFLRPPLCHVDLMQAFLTHVFGCPQSISFAFSSRPRIQLRPYLKDLFPPESPPPKWVIYGSLLLLNRLKEKHPDTNWKWAIRLLVPSLMVAAKFLSDMCPWRQIHWWSIARYVSRRELKEWERRFCRLLDWDLILELRELEDFEQQLKQDFHPGNNGKRGSWPMPAKKWRLQNPNPRMPDSFSPNITTSALSPDRQASLPKTSHSYPAPPAYAAPPPYHAAAPPISYPPCPPVLPQYHPAPPSPLPCPPLLSRYHVSVVPSPCPPALPQYYASAIPSLYESAIILPRYPASLSSCALVPWTQLLATPFYQ